MICDRNDNGICKSPWCYHKSAGGTCLNPRFKFKPTNADRIRSMTDEELAEFLWSQNGSNRYWKSAQKYLDWLKQPAKEAP